jgi:GR25 family glycosyltransferase involved in LPS biosynthesis
MNIVFSNKFITIFHLFLKKLLRLLTKKHRLEMFGVSKNRIEVVYVINLDRQIERWKQFEKEAQIQKAYFNKTLLDFSCRISAVDGKKIDLENIETMEINRIYNLIDQYYVDPDPRLLEVIRERNICIDMTKQEIAVALSHLKSWQKIVNDKISFALILEDDIFFEQYFAYELNRIWKELSSNNIEIDLLYLSFREVDHGAEIKSFSKYLSKPIKGIWWLSGYILSYSGAKKLLQELPISGPIDLWLNHKFNKINVYCSKKSIIFQRSDFKSDNSYSILPILSQIGIQSNKTHLDLERKKGENPIFVIGYNKKSVDVIGLILSMLGYRCCINRWDEFSACIEKIIINNEPLLFDVYVGFKIFSIYYTKLKSLYPNAVFIVIKNETDIQFLENSSVIEIKHILNLNNEKFLKTFCKVINCIPLNIPFEKIKIYSNNIQDINFNESQIIAFDNRPLRILEHDVHPWIIPIEKLSNYGIDTYKTRVKLVGEYKHIICDSAEKFDHSNWYILESTFPTNLAFFKKDNFSITKKEDIKLTIVKERIYNKEYSSASIATRESYQYGRFEVTMKPAKGSGIISAIFLHRNDPWQEIDFEFLGDDTTKLLSNVYYNPGVDGVKNNFGNRGTPIVIELGFDAAFEYHKYSIEWEPHEIRWYVDTILIHLRKTWEPTPIPDLPMQFYINTWISKSEELVGKFEDNILPKDTFLNEINIYNWLYKKE